MGRRTSLREFQRSLSERISRATVNPQAASLLAVKAGDRGLLVNLAEISEVIPVPPLSDVPLTQSWFRGVVNIRGNLYGVTDLSAYSGDPPVIAAGAARLLLVKPEIAASVALLVSSTAGLRPASALHEIDTPGSDAQTTIEYTDASGARWIWLSIGRLAGSPRFLDIAR